MKSDPSPPPPPSVADGGASGDAGPSAVGLPPLIHMGGSPGVIMAPWAHTLRPFEVAASRPTAKTLTLEVAQVYAGAVAPVWMLYLPRP